MVIVILLLASGAGEGIISLSLLVSWHVAMCFGMIATQLKPPTAAYKTTATSHQILEQSALNMNFARDVKPVECVISRAGPWNDNTTAYDLKESLKHLLSQLEPRGEIAD